MEDKKENKFEKFSDKIYNTLDNFLEKKTKDTILVFTSFFMIWNSFMTYTVRRNEDFGFDQGKKAGIELMQTIYNTQGGNEALRYSIKSENYSF